MSKENYKQQKYREIHNEMEEEDQKKCFVMSLLDINRIFVYRLIDDHTKNKNENHTKTR